MLTGQSIWLRTFSALLMMAALLFLTTANFWVYGCKKEKQSVSANSASDEEQDSGSSVPNPVEEKNSNALQNLSEYLHDYHSMVLHPLTIQLFGNRHDIITLPIHHPELLTPPPKPLG